MGHLHTGPGEHDWTVSAYIVRTDESPPRLLLHRHKLLGRYMQFGGHVEPTHNPWQALAAEILQETGYGLDQLRLLQPSMGLHFLPGVQLHPLPLMLLTHPFAETDHYHTDLAWAFTAEGPPRQAVAPGESAVIKGFTVQELAKLPPADIPEDVRQIGLFVLRQGLSDLKAMPAETWS